MPRIGSIITYVLLCGYSPFRSDDMKELVRQTTEAKITFHDRYWSNVSEEGTVSSHTHLNSPIYLTHRHTAKGFIRALLNPDPTKRLTASEALTHPWLTTTPSPSTSQPDLSGLRENFDPRARWRNAIGAARAITRMGGLAQRSRSKLVSSDDDDDGEEGDTTSLKVPSPKALRTSSSSSSSIAMAISPSQPEKPEPQLQPPKAADAPLPTPAPKTPVRATSHLNVEKETEVEVERRMPGSFNYKSAGQNVDAASPVDVIGVLGGIWRRFHLRA
jgi:calcium/calmodulin-dependent protein kinase I